MKPIIVAALAFAVLAAPAAAADLPGRQPAFQGLPVAPFTWTGFYVGAHAGYQSADSELRAAHAALLPGPLSGFGGAGLRSEGAMGGVQVGFNMHVLPSSVVGLEADVGFAHHGSRLLVAGATGFDRFGTDHGIYGSVRARLGYAVNRWMLFATAGVGFADIDLVSAHARAGSPTTIQSRGDLQVGWAAGAGIEHAFSRNWSVRVEYLAMGFEDRVLAIPQIGGTFDPSGHAVARTVLQHVRLGVNYRF